MKKRVALAGLGLVLLGAACTRTVVIRESATTAPPTASPPSTYTPPTYTTPITAISGMDVAREMYAQNPGQFVSFCNAWDAIGHNHAVGLSAFASGYTPTTPSAAEVFDALLTYC